MLKPATLEHFGPRPEGREGLRTDCRACVNARCAGYRLAAPTTQAEATRRWRAADPERAKRIGRAADARRRADPGFRLSKAISRRIRELIEKPPAKPRKQPSWVALLGYDVTTLRLHLERQFAPGMTWANYGTVWEIDHVQPVARFAITGADCPEMRACWALSNLRPLWSEVNRRKWAKRELLL